MKKVLLLSLTLLLCASVAFSQFGIKAGINLATAGGADKGDLKGKVGFAAGVSSKMGLIAGLSIQPEILYIQKGAMWENPFHKTTFNLTYIDIPVLVKFNLPVPVLSPYIEGGLSYGILLSAKEKTEFTALAGSLPTEEVNIKDGMTKGDLSILVGIGVELAIIDINARYIIGMTKLYKDSDAKIFNRGILLTAGLRL